MEMVEEVLRDLEKLIKLDRRNGKQLLGMLVKRDMEAGTLSLSMPVLIKEAIIKFGMEGCNPVSTPMELNFDATPYTGENIGVPMQQLCGTLGWIAETVRPDIKSSTAMLQRFAHNPSPAQWTAAKRVLRYLAGTIEWGLVFGLNPGAPIIEVFSDSDWAGDPDTRKSVTGGAVFVMGSLVIAVSKKQSSITKSSAEAEFVAVSTMSSNIAWVSGRN